MSQFTLGLLLHACEDAAIVQAMPFGAIRLLQSEIDLPAQISDTLILLR